MISDKAFAGKGFEDLLADHGITLLRPTRKREMARRSEPLLKKVRQLIESVNNTLKGQLDPARHGRHSCAGAAIRATQYVLALAAAPWHNNHTGAPLTRSLTTHDHRPGIGPARLGATTALAALGESPGRAPQLCRIA